MAKTNISFNNKNYSIDDSALSAASSALKSHLSITMAGTGAKIMLGGTAYNIDPSKLSTATTEFVTHLGTISGNGAKVKVKGVEYSVDTTKLSSVISDMHNVLDGLVSSEPDITTLAPGLYETGAIAMYQSGDAEGASAMLKTSWEDLVASGVIAVSEGPKLPEGAVLNEYGFYYGVKYGTTMEGVTIDFTFNADGSAIFNSPFDGVIDIPAGAILYDDHTIDMSALDFPVFTVSEDGTSIEGEGIVMSVGGSGGFYPKGAVYLPELDPYNPTSIVDGDLVIIDDGSATGFADTAFCRQDSLSDIMIPDSVTSIGDYSFQGCSSLTSIIIPDSVTSIGDYSFKDCSSLTSITIPDSVTSIGDYSFQGCSSLTSIIIPDSVTSIGDYSFQGCSSLTSIVIPNGVTSIGNNVTSIGDYAFDGCYTLANVYITDLAAWCSTDFGYGSANPLYHANNLYVNNELVTDLIIPDSVTGIGTRAFYCYSSLTSVTIGNNVTSIGASAFESCDNLEVVNIGSGVTNIKSSTFKNCASLTGIWVAFDNPSYSHDERGVLYNKDKASLVAVPMTISGEYTILNGVASIGQNAFYKCSRLTSIEIPEGVTSIGMNAFNGCTGINSLVIPDSVTHIDNSAFYNCSKLISITIPEGVPSIGEWAFSDCTSLKNITIPSSVTRIGSHAFNGCSSMTGITFNGTSAQWNLITKGANWKGSAPVARVTCSDGQVAL